MILAVDAHTALALLDAPSPDEQALLGSIRFERSTLVVHRDAGVMPRDRRLWSYGNYRDEGREAAPGALAGDMTYWAGGPPVFVTVTGGASPPMAEEAVVARREWSHMVVDTTTLGLRLGPLQGRRRTWSAAGTPRASRCTEHALCSGLAVAEALGAAYPFAGDEAAMRAYASFKARVVG